MKRKFDVVFTIISIVLGGLLGVAVTCLYDAGRIAFTSRIPTVVLGFMAFILIMAIVLLVKGLTNGTFVHFGRVMAFTLAAFACFIGCSALFEFIYELGDNKPKSFNTTNVQYVFLVDDSGSMDTSDPSSERYAALESIVNNLNSDDKFAVYRFGSSIMCHTPLGQEQPGSYQISNSNLQSVGGGTALFGSIDYIISEVADPDNVHTKIIVLTDGAPGDSGEVQTVDNSKDNNTSISAVGFGSSGAKLLNDLANSTGGTFVYVDDISALTSNLETIVNAPIKPLAKNRDLIGARADATYDSFLYGFLRVLFLILLGGLWTIVKMLLVGEKKFTRFATVMSITLCIVAALLCEAMFYCDVFDGFIRVVFFALWACTLIPKKAVEKGVNISTGSLDSDLTGRPPVKEDKSLYERPTVTGESKSFL